MGTEAFFRENLVVIEHAQSSELHAFRVEIIGEAEMVMFMIDIGGVGAVFRLQNV